MTLTPTARKIASQYGQTRIGDSIVAAMTSAKATPNTTYNPAVWANAAAAQAEGSTPWRNGTQYMWFDWDGETYDMSAVDPVTVQEGIDTYGDETYPLIVDIEEWSPLTETSEFLDNVLLALEMWTTQTHRTIGVYSMCPYHDYNAPTRVGDNIDTPNAEALYWRQSQLAVHQNLNEKVFGYLSPYVDFLMPDCYMSTDELTRWKWFAAYQILESRRLSATIPIVPVWWFGYNTTGTEISEANWIGGLQFLSQFTEIEATAIYVSDPAPVGYTYTDAVVNLLTQAGEFAPPEPP